MVTYPGDEDGVGVVATHDVVGDKHGEKTAWHASYATVDQVGVGASYTVTRLVALGLVDDTQGEEAQVSHGSEFSFLVCLVHRAIVVEAEHFEDFGDAFSGTYEVPLALVGGSDNDGVDLFPHSPQCGAEVVGNLFSELLLEGTLTITIRLYLVDVDGSQH